MSKKDLIRDIVIALLLISTLFLGYKVITLDSKIQAAQSGIQQVIDFINKAVQANQK